MELSSPDRVVFPEDGIVKADVFEYYRMVSPQLLRYVKGRPLTVERYPKGIGGGGFMQKNVPPHAPPQLVDRCNVKREGGSTTYPVIHDVEGLLFFANLGVITFHVPPSTIEHLRQPDWVIWDLDPPPDAKDAVRHAALALREVLLGFDIPCSLMATGSKGYHLRTGIRPNIEANLVSQLARGIAALAEAAHPDLMTLAFKKAERGGRVFVDWLRNMPLSTSVAPWSLRPSNGAPVACPLSWSEIDDVDPDGIRLTDVARRLEADCWMGQSPVDVTDAVERVRHALTDAGVTLTPFDRFRS